MSAPDTLQSPPLPPPRFAAIDGITTAFYRAGHGLPIVMIYGGNFGSPDSCSSAYTWNLNFAALATQFEVIAFDKLGQGLTGNPSVIQDYTMKAVVRHAAAFIRSLHLPPVHLIGHSRGGYAATRIAMDHPELVGSLTIVSSGTLSPRLSTNDVVLSRCPFPPASRESARWVYEQYSCNPAVVTSDWMEVVHQMMSLPKHQQAVQVMVDQKAYSRIFIPELAHQKRETLAWLRDGGLQRPTQIIFGQNDRTVAIEGAFDLLAMIALHQRQTELHIFNQSGHFPFREHPRRFNSLIASFVSLINERRAGT